MKKDNSPARGTRDLLPDEVRSRESLLATITGVYQRFGYQRIETPALEDIERLTGGQGGENEKLIYQILRRRLPAVLEAGTPVSDLVDLGLRFDLTVPLARFYAQHRAALRLPFRALQAGPVWRAERPQRGRYRQFIQCDIDVIGEPGPLAEAELIEATTTALREVGLTDTTVRISDRRLLAAIAQAAEVPEASWSSFFITLDKLDKVGWDGVRAELAGKGVPAASIGRAQDLIERLQDVDGSKLAPALTEALPALGEQVAADLSTTATCLAGIGLDYGTGWLFDPALVRGMGYYTGQIFEISHRDLPGSLAGGGRYDQLIGRSAGQEIPACGFSIGFERLAEILAPPPPPASLVVLADADVPVPDATALAARLRADGRQVTVVRRAGKLGAQLGRLHDWGFSSVVMVRLRDGQAQAEPERPLSEPPAAQ
jgi:histidyl-tRNA synthetase